MRPPLEGQDWVGLSEIALPVGAALDWVASPGCGAQVLFTGTVRDHADGRPGVSSLEYEAYVEHVEPRLAAVAAEARRRWPTLGRLVMLHRIGLLEVGDCAVVVVATAPHRDEAFEAARWSIDTIKASVPIWKKETWSGGVDWGTCAHDVAGVGDAQSVGGDGVAGAGRTDAGGAGGDAGARVAGSGVAGGGRGAGGAGGAGSGAGGGEAPAGAAGLRSAPAGSRS